MRMVHTADWHIGRMLCDVPLLEDQRVFLDRLCERLAALQADLLVIAGDLFDRSVPSAEAVELLDAALWRIVGEMGIPVVAVAGNHDSPARLAFASRLYREGGLYLAGRYTGRIDRVELRDRYGPVRFYLLPYLVPEAVRRQIADSHPDARGADAIFRAVCEREEDFDPGMRNVLVTHGFFTGSGAAPVLSDSEMGVGGGDAIGIGPATDFDYIALGHLHSAQPAGLPHARYAGSPLPYSLSEAGRPKSLTVIDLGPKGERTITTEPIRPLRALRILTGRYDTLLAAGREDPNPDDYIFAVLEDDGIVPDAMGGLRAVYPNMLGVRFALLERENEAVLQARPDRHDSLEALFAGFYQDLRGETIPEARARLVHEIAQRVREGEEG